MFMAANLLADLDDFYSSGSQGHEVEGQQQNNAPSVNVEAFNNPESNYGLLEGAFGTTHAREESCAGQDEFDDFGDFEMAEPVRHPQPIAQPEQRKPVTTQRTAKPREPAAQKHYVKNPRTENVLFDAEAEDLSEDEEDFGDFEEM